MNKQQPTPEQVIARMKQMMNGQVPRTVRNATKVMPEMVVRQAVDRAFAMPPEGALDEPTRTMIYLAVALAAGSEGCIEAMMNKARAENISKGKLLEVYKIVRFAEASRVFAGAADMFAKLEAEWE